MCVYVCVRVSVRVCVCVCMCVYVCLYVCVHATPPPPVQEWHLKCSHYVVVCSGKGELSDVVHTLHSQAGQGVGEGVGLEYGRDRALAVPVTLDEGVDVKTLQRCVVCVCVCGGGGVRFYRLGWFGCGSHSTCCLSVGMATGLVKHLPWFPLEGRGRVGY